MTRKLSLLALLPLLALLNGCKMVVLFPSGDIARQQSHLLLVATCLMLIVIVPVIVMTIVFAWRYRASNQDAVYEPDWNHSTKLEFVIWGGPLLIIIALGLVTWITTHTLDPYRPLDRISANQPIPADVKPITVEVVALDWKWLFIYPEYGFATVNELAAPVNVPIRFKITASNVMNSFFIPSLAGQIYAMPGMETKLHAVMNEPGEYEGFSSNYSGAGYSHMRFKFLGLSQPDFDKWVQAGKASKNALSRESYLELVKPSIKDPVSFYGSVSPELYDAVINRCVDSKDMCQNQMMAIDAKGGLGLGGIDALASKPSPYASMFDGSSLKKQVVVSQLCTAQENTFRE
ncbi:cytochrome bo3 quinol oxidase subunit 2 [Polynucleobacter meluiroseus]|uniref:Ubiquinol oxidase subunit 2 n=1 Tax=Polynucleobacter meluiroseus TaxID=1938814 RepID=A0A240DYH9_9BURK|nr:ubiquinol oxidase subunit II [Polynucleobacter meluiroseus]SNX28073.1 cytochrome bo3 quinol oxidase subunit 2 [Polynucleobacter meluiroseus]